MEINNAVRDELIDIPQSTIIVIKLKKNFLDHCMNNCMLKQMLHYLLWAGNITNL